MEYKSPTAFDRLKQWVRGSISLRLITIAILILILLIPVTMIEGLIRERSQLRESVVSEVSNAWSQSQVLTGPLLSVPYTYLLETAEGELVERMGYAYFLPDLLDINGAVSPEVRYRSIYEVVVYTTNLQVEGQFTSPNFSAFDIEPEDILWEDAAITVGLSDLRGINDGVLLNWDGQEYAFGPGTATTEVIEAGITTPVSLDEESSAAGTFTFSFDVSLNGSRSLYFTPLGQETNIALSSSWPDPSFEGAFLPDERSVDDAGFSASWKVLHLNRNYPQAWLGQKHMVAESSFGVRLMMPVDTYQKTTRSAKYAIMFILLTFVTFFFVEVMHRKRIHPIQYIMIGIALAIFYVLLLSISEHLTFNIAFILSSVATTGLISLYCITLFKNGRLVLLTAGLLVMMYGFIYTVLQLQDYALLIGSLGLFIVLASFMYLSRKINWYAPTAEEQSNKESQAIL